MDTANQGEFFLNASAKLILFYDCSFCIDTRAPFFLQLINNNPE